jgi:hypothetical protein
VSTYPCLPSVDRRFIRRTWLSPPTYIPAHCLGLPSYPTYFSLMRPSRPADSTFRLQSLKTLPDTLRGISWVSSQLIPNPPMRRLAFLQSILTMLFSGVAHIWHRSRLHLSHRHPVLIVRRIRAWGRCPCNLLPRSSNTRKLPKVFVSRYVVAIQLGSNFRPLCDLIPLAQTSW